MNNVSDEFQRGYLAALAAVQQRLNRLELQRTRGEYGAGKREGWRDADDVVRELIAEASRL